MDCQRILGFFLILDHLLLRKHTLPDLNDCSNKHISKPVNLILGGVSLSSFFAYIIGEGFGNLEYLLTSFVKLINQSVSFKSQFPYLSNESWIE